MEPPDPMFNKDTPKWEVFKWYAVVIPIGLLWMCTIPFTYLVHYYLGWRARQHNLTSEEVWLCMENEGRYVKAIVEAFLAIEPNPHKRYTVFKLPGAHPAVKRVIVKTKHEYVCVHGRW